MDSDFASDLLQALGTHVVAVRGDQPTAATPVGVLFVAPRESMDSGSVYLCDASGAETLADTAVPANVIIVFGADVADDLAVRAGGHGLTVSTDLDIPALHNIVVRAIAASRSGDRARREREALIERVLDAPGRVIDGSAEALFGGPADTFDLIVAGDGSARPQPPSPTLASQLASLLPDATVVRRPSAVVIVNPRASRHTPIPPPVRAAIEAALAADNVFAAVSTFRLENSAIARAHELATLLLTISARRPRMRQRTRLLTQEDSGIFLVLELYAAEYARRFGGSTPLALAHPGILVLLEYDRVHRSDLRETLFMYLTLDRSLSLTAERMHTHRNTVYNKVKKVRELIGVNLDDYRVRDSLLFSNLMVSYFTEP